MIDLKARQGAGGVGGWSLIPPFQAGEKRQTIQKDILAFWAQSSLNDNVS